MERPSVSVLIDTYNHERFIEQAIVSVVEQDYPAGEREIIVVDDGSTDGTPAIIQKFGSQVRYLRKENGGQASAFNAGIPECRGPIVAFLDGDDWWAPTKLSKVMTAMAAEPAVGIVGHGILIVGRDGHGQTEVLREGFRFQGNTVEGAKLLRRRGSFLGTSRMTIRAELLRRIGPVPEAIKIEADEYLFTLAAVLSEARILPEMLTYYRIHDANAFQFAESASPQKLRNKQQYLASLAASLAQKLDELGIAKPIRRALMDYTQASAEQLRLQLDGGWPWETAKTEWTLYRIVHPEADLVHRLFKICVLAGVMFIPPRTYYRAHQFLTRNDSYRRARQRWLPIPEVEHIQKERRTNS